MVAQTPQRYHSDCRLGESSEYTTGGKSGCDRVVPRGVVSHPAGGARKAAAVKGAQPGGRMTGFRVVPVSSFNVACATTFLFVFSNFLHAQTRPFDDHQNMMEQ